MNHVVDFQQMILSYIPMIAGAAGVPTIQQIVQFIRVEFFRLNKVSAYLAPIFAVLVGVGINVGVAILTHNSIVDGVMIGMLSGALASGYHELTN
jgi:hypothetical protein